MFYAALKNYMTNLELTTKHIDNPMQFMCRVPVYFDKTSDGSQHTLPSVAIIKIHHLQKKFEHIQHFTDRGLQHVKLDTSFVSRFVFIRFQVQCFAAQPVKAFIYILLRETVTELNLRNFPRNIRQIVLTPLHRLAQ